MVGAYSGGEAVFPYLGLGNILPGVVTAYDSRQPCWTEPFSGERYAVEVYLDSRYRLLSPADRRYLRSLGFRLPTDGSLPAPLALPASPAAILSSRIGFSGRIPLDVAVNKGVQLSRIIQDDSRSAPKVLGVSGRLQPPLKVGIIGKGKITDFGTRDSPLWRSVSEINGPICARSWEIRVVLFVVNLHSGSCSQEPGSIAFPKECAHRACCLGRL